MCSSRHLVAFHPFYRARRIAARIISAAIVIGIALPPESLADETAQGEGRRASVILISVGETAAERALEERFLTELSLNAETFRVSSVTAGVKGFLQLPFEDQIERVQSLARRYGAKAVLWLNAASPNHLLLQTAVPDVGRAVVRIFRQDRGPDAVTELALTVAGFLDTAYETAHTPAQSPQAETLPDAADGAASLSADPASRSSEVSASRKFEPNRAARRGSWHLRLNVTQDGPISAHRGPGLGTGGVFDAERSFRGPIRLDLGVGGAFQPYGKPPLPVRGGWRIRLETRLLLLYGTGTVGGGPLLGLEGGVNGALVEDETGPRSALVFGDVRINAGAALRVDVSKTHPMALAAGIFASPARVAVRRESNGEVLLETAVVGWWVRLGMILF